MYILAKRLKSRGMLNGNTVVATIMSNSGLIASLKEEGIECAQTTVGDRFVYECMQNNDYSLGGEQSGHIIFSSYATTGDGILTSLKIMEIMLSEKAKLSELVSGFKEYPQVLMNITVKDKGKILDNKILIDFFI